MNLKINKELLSFKAKIFKNFGKVNLTCRDLENSTYIRKWNVKSII